MYLKELEIFGFKSFPEKTTLKFESGITVVVGPNGCGKSNIFDSIKWALGEQSPKSLRGAKMEDIIFNGTENYPPLNYAEVSLTFCNEDKYLPIDYREVLVARRLYRSGESQYFINKNVVRLKDVQELFMGTGIGESTYSFIEQGKIEIFLSYKPEDKRLIFDEASGIIKYKEKKREALRRLDETEDNLLRLEDIIIEVRRQTRYLEIQVEKAKKFKEVQQQLVEVEKKIASLQFRELEGRINKLLDESGIFKEKEENKGTQLNQANDRWEELNNNIKTLRIELEEAATTIVSLRAQTESSTSHIAINRQRIKEIQERDITLELAKGDFNQRLQLQDERSRQEVERLAQIEQEVKELDEQTKEIEAEKSQLQERSQAAKKKTKDEKTKVLELESKKSQLHNTLIEIQTQNTSLINRKKRLILDKAKLETLLAENNGRLNAAEEESAKSEADLGILQAQKADLTRKEKELNALTEDAKSGVVNKEKEYLELRASYEFLKDLHVKYETFSEKRRITVIFDEEPKNINKLVASLQDVEFKPEGGVYKAQIEAKVISFEEKQLEDRITGCSRRIEEIKAKVQSLEEEKVKFNSDLSSENAQIEQLKKILQEKLQEKESSRREVERLNEEFELVSGEEKTTLDDIKDCQAKQGQIEQELFVFDEDLSRANESLFNCQEIITKSSERINDIDIGIARNSTQEQSLHKEKEALNSKINLFLDEINNIKSGLLQVDKERQEGSLRIVSFNGQIENLEAKITQDNTRIEQFILRKTELEQKETSRNAEIDRIKESVNKLDKENQELRSSIYNKKLEIQSFEYEKEKIKDYLHQVYNIDFVSVSPDELTESLEGFTVNKEKLQKKIKSLGEVNLVAIEEFKELKEREDFLETQKLDLVTSNDELKKAIAKINRTSKELFMDTFTKIEVEFKKHFKFLFNGGRANLILIDKDNILESGVEIEVQPPGKKLQNVSLLSGGEKALTAIALIFAIFSVRPSPLCVLDEIDAPLDDANVDRFNHLLRKFASASQFVLITHNKKSMSNADVLYGITMQERGISKLVSVKFASDQIPA